MQVFHVEKYNVEQSGTIPNSQSISIVLKPYLRLDIIVPRSSFDSALTQNCWATL